MALSSKILMPVSLKCWQLHIAVDNIPESKWQCQWKEILVNGDIHLLLKVRKKEWVLLLRYCLRYCPRYCQGSPWFVVISCCRQSCCISCQCCSDCGGWWFLTNSAFLCWIKPGCNTAPSPLPCRRHHVASFGGKERAFSHKSGTYGEERKVLNYNIAVPNFFCLICTECFPCLHKSNPMHNGKDLKVWVQSNQLSV